MIVDGMSTAELARLVAHSRRKLCVASQRGGNRELRTMVPTANLLDQLVLRLREREARDHEAEERYLTGLIHGRNTAPDRDASDADSSSDASDEAVDDDDSSDDSADEAPDKLDMEVDEDMAPLRWVPSYMAASLHPVKDTAEVDAGLAVLPPLSPTGSDSEESDEEEVHAVQIRLPLCRLDIAQKHPLRPAVIRV